LFENELAVKLY